MSGAEGTMTNMKRLVATIVACGLVLAACSGGDDSASPDSTAPATTAPSGGDADAVDLDDLLEDDGTVSLETALAVFAATFAPLEGVEPAPNSMPDSDVVVLNLLVEHRDELSESQRAVLDQVLGPPGVPLDELGGGAGNRRLIGGERSNLAQPLIRESIAEWERRLGRGLGGILITVVEMPLIDADTGVRNFSDLGNAAVAIRMLNDGVYDECKVKLNIDSPFNDSVFRSQVSHEIFHCFQYALVNTNPLPRWIVEGAAAYAGEVFAGGTAQSDSWWRRWIEEPNRAITARSYDAIGLFSASAAVGADPFTYFDALLTDPTTGPVERAGGATLKDRLGTHFANEPGWGAPWQVTGPGAPATQARRAPLSFTDNAARFSTVPAADSLSGYAYSFTAPGDVLVVLANGFGGVRFSNGASAAFSGGLSAAFCLLPGGCVCADEPAERGGMVAASRDGFVGLGPGSAPSMTGQTLEQWCLSDPLDSVPPVDPGAGEGDGDGGCLVGDWSVDAEAMVAVFRSLDNGEASEGPTEYQVSGSWTMTVGADGSLTTVINNWTLTYDFFGPGGLGSDEPVPLRFTLVFNGTVNGRWSASGSTLSISGAAGTISATATGEVMGQTFDVTSPQMRNLSIGNNGASTYTCSADRLTLTAQVAGGLPLHFVR